MNKEEFAYNEVSQRVSTLEDALKAIAEWKILDEEKQKAVEKQQEEIKLGLSTLTKCVNELNLLIVKTYVTKEELRELSRKQDEKFAEVNEKFAEVHGRINKKEDKKEDKNAATELIFNFSKDIIKLLLCAVVTLAGYKIIF